MNFEDVLQELIQQLGFDGDKTVSWEEVREWPDGAIDIFKNAGWIKRKAPAKSVVCPGCEENCFMPVHVSQTMQGQPSQIGEDVNTPEGHPVKSYVACDRRDDMGRIPIPPDYLQQWQVTENQVAQWVAREFGLRGRPKKDKATRTILVGEVQGKKQSGRLELVSMEPASLKASGHLLPLNEIVFLDGNQPRVDKQAIINVVDRPSPPDRYQPSIARREARKKETQEMYTSWRKAHREWKRKRPNMSDRWYSQQIARMDIAQDKSPETIRKNMKK